MTHGTTPIGATVGVGAATAITTLGATHSGILTQITAADGTIGDGTEAGATTTVGTTTDIGMDMLTGTTMVTIMATEMAMPTAGGMAMAVDGTIHTSSKRIRIILPEEIHL